MKIPEFGTLQMTRTHEAHTGRTTLSDIAGAPQNKIPSAAESGIAKTRRSFDAYLLDAFKTMNSQQLNVDAIGQQVLSEPDSIDAHDVAIAMAKARMSLNLAQTVIDRIVSGWNDITTTR